MADPSPSNWHNENGFEYALYPAKNTTADSLIIYMHGVGSNAKIDASYLRSMRDKIPGADIILLQAPIEIKSTSVPSDEKGYSWVPFGGPLKPQVQAWLSHVFNRMPVAEQVEAFASAQLTKRGLTEENLAYFGHSMGAIVALQAGLSGDKPVAAIVSRGGTVLPFTKAVSKPKVFLQMGELDELFNGAPPPPTEKGFLRRAFSLAGNHFSLRHERSVERLQKQQVPLTEKVYPKQGHGHDYTAWNEGVDFIAKALPQRKP